MKNDTTNNNDRSELANIDADAAIKQMPTNDEPRRIADDAANRDLVATSDPANQDDHPAENVTGYVSGNKSSSEKSSLHADITAAASIFGKSTDSSPPNNTSDENRRSPDKSEKIASPQSIDMGRNGDTPGDKYTFTATYKNTRTENGEHHTTGEFHVQPAKKKEKSPGAQRTEKSRQKSAKSGWIRAEFKLRAGVHKPLEKIVDAMNEAAMAGESFYPRLAELIQRLEGAS